MIITLDETTREIVELAMQEGKGESAEDIVRIALADWWNNQPIPGYTAEDMRRIGEEIIADTRPGIPADQAIAQLREHCRKLDAQRTADAA